VKTRTCGAGNLRRAASDRVRGRPQHIGADENLREALDIDSFDFLNVPIGLHERPGVEIPEADGGPLTTLSALVQYLSRKLAGNPGRAS
jgi:acyl carrier protein